MATEIAVMLAVTDARAAVEFYTKAFGAEVYWTIGGDEHMVAGLAIGGARFFLATESPEFGTRGPSAAGFTTARIELFVDDPVAVQAKAVSAGATLRNAVQEHNYQTEGPKPIGRMLQGSVVDPFGHMWLVGKFLD
jgi:PhnB protein